MLIADTCIDNRIRGKYGELYGLRMTCRKEEEILDRRFDWLHRMNLLADQLEMTWTVIVYH